MRLFSDKHRPTHLGSYPLERLKRIGSLPDLSAVPDFTQVNFQRPESPQNIVNAMDEYQSMLDALRDGLVNKSLSEIPEDLQERANHLKGFGYFSDASMVACCELPCEALLDQSIRNPAIDALAEDLRTKQTKTLAAGIDMIMAELKESMEAPPTDIDDHTHALVFLYEYPRDPKPDEPGYEWIENAQAERACLRASETAVVIANYLRLLGYPSRVHSATTSDLDLNKLTVAAGLATVEQGELKHPYLENGFGVAVVTTTLQFACDKPLAAFANQPKSVTQGLAWKLGKGFAKSASNQLMYKNRRFVDGMYPFEKLKRVEATTTFIDAARVARVPKRADMFARAQFGDMGKKVQDGATGGL